MERQFNQLIEYIKIHKLSLEQDLESLNKEYTDSYDYVTKEAQISVLNHILQYAKEIDKSVYEGV